MNMNIPLLAELKQEAATTRKMLALVPMDKLDWKPHEKSMALKSLARHIGNIPTWLPATLLKDELDLATAAPAPDFNSPEELLAHFDKNIAEATRVLEATKDEDFAKNWTLRSGDKKYFTMPKGPVLRNFVFNHIVHHRAQLGVYYRLLNIALPGSYGPSADHSGM